MKMPNPIAIRFAKLIFSILSITVLGVIFAMISHDHTMMPSTSSSSLRKTRSMRSAQTGTERANSRRRSPKRWSW